MTAKQQEILEFMLAFQADNCGRSPTLAEVGAKMNRTKTTVWEHIQALVESGHVATRGVSSATRRYIARSDVCPTCGGILQTPLEVNPDAVV